MKSVRSRGIWEELGLQRSLLEESRKENEKWHAEIRITFNEFIKRFDRSEANWKEERREMEARIAAYRKETAERLAADRKEATERLEAERKESKREFISQKRWLIATFVTVFVGMGSIFAAFVVLIMQLT